MQDSDKPNQELEKARSQIKLMRQAENLEQLEEHWKDFLSKLERVWHKAYNHFSRSPKWNGWKGKYEQARKKDPLLSYLVNARHADEHTVSDITGRETGGIGINPAEGKGLYIEKMEIRNGVINIKSPQNLAICFIPDKVKLLPVTNYGRVYEVPTSHLGTPIDPSNVVAVAEVAASYYAKFLEEARAFFVK